MPNTKIVWDGIGDKLYELGVDHCVLYPQVESAYPKGIAWNGITAINEQPSGAESDPKFADGIQYLNLISAEKYGSTLEAYTYPDEFALCDGSAEPTPGMRISQQARKAFGLSYRTLIGSDTDGQDHGYKLHLVYGCMAAPSERSHQTVNDSPEAITFSWELTTTPVPVAGFRPTAHIEIDSTKVDPEKMTKLENALYGDGESVSAHLPLPEEVITLLTALPAKLKV